MTTPQAQSRSGPAVARHPVLALTLLVTGAACLAISATTLFTRFDTWKAGQAVPSNGAVVLHLGAGHQLVYQLCGVPDCPDLTAAQVTVTELGAGATLATSIDPSEDRAGPGDTIGVGVVAFTTPTSGRYRVAITGPEGRQFVVAFSPGQEVRHLAAWIALGVTSLLAVLVGGVMLLSWRTARRRRRSVGPPSTPGLGSPILSSADRPLRLGENPRIVS